MRCLCALLVAAVCLAAQEKAPALATVEGVVLNQATGEPLRRAEVVLSGARGGPAPAVTGADGRFQITGLAPGAYSVTWRRAGFTPSFERGSATSIKLAGGQKLSGLAFYMLPQAVVAGRIADEDGEAVQGVSVMLLRSRYSRGRRTLTPSGSAATNDRGEYRIYNLPPGRALLVVQPPRVPEPTTAGVPAMQYVGTYYPGTVDSSQATVLALAAGAELLGMDIRLRRAPVFRVTGKVISAVTGEPVRNYTVFLAGEEGGAAMGGFGRLSRGRDGEFEILSVRPGSYTLHAQTGNPDRLSAALRVDVSGSDVEGLTVLAGPGLELTGSIELAGDGPQPTPATMRVSLVSAGNMTGRMDTPVRNWGPFTVRGVGPGRYLLDLVSIPPGTYIDSIKAGEADLLRGELDVAPGAPPLSIVLRNDPGSVAGLVRDPGGRGNVALVPAEAALRRSPFLKYSPLDQSGVFEFRDVRPGEYLLYAAREIEPGELEDPAVFSSVERGMTRVKVERNAVASAELELQSRP